MNVKELYDLLKKAQEPKGYYFNKDTGQSLGFAGWASGK